MTVSTYNQLPLNQQAMKLLNQYQIPFNPTTELSALVLVRTAVERNLLETREIQEPDLLIAKLAANPGLAMSLMIESEPGVQFTLELPDKLEEAAAMLLEEILASLKATQPMLLP